MDTTSDNKVAELLREGKISPAEAERLRRAMGDRRPPSRWALLLDPLPVLPARAAVALALVVAAACVTLSIATGIRFDGALDVHLGAASSARPATALVDLAVAWPLTALILWGGGRLAGGRGRLADVLVALGVARVASLVSALLTVALTPVLLGPGAEVIRDGQPTTGVLILGLAMLPLVGWTVWLFYTAYRHATGLAGKRAAISFVVAITVAEIVSKAALMAIRV